jgi:hypothetical protein
MTVAGNGPIVDSSRLGRYLKKYQDRPIGKFKFTCSEGRAHSALWRLRVQNDDDTWPKYPEDPDDPAKETITRTLTAHPDLSGAGWKYPHTRDHPANRTRVLEDDEG